MPFLTAEQAEAVASSTVHMATLVEMQFRSRTMRLWNGFSRLRVSDAEWTGAGLIGSISGLTQTRQLTSEKVTLNLDATTAEVQALAVAGKADAEGQPCLIWLQLLTGQWQPLGARIPAFWGIMQHLSIERSAASGDGGGTRTVKIDVENPFAARARAPARFYTDQDQQADHPGDRFFRYVSAQLTDTVIWPDY